MLTFTSLFIDSLLHIAVREGNFDAVHFLVECKASINTLNFKVRDL